MIVRMMSLAGTLLALAPSAALAADAAPATTEIHLTEQATRMIAPDRLRAQLRVEAKSSDARQLQADINRRMQAALDKAKRHPEVTAETGAYAVNRDYSAKDKERWLGTQVLILSGKDFGALLALAGELQGDGMLVSDMRYEVARETLAAAQSALTASALAALKTRAGEVAAALGLALDRFKSVTVGNATTNVNPMPMARFQAAGMAASPMPPPAAEAGEATVSLTVTADVILAKP